jgi:phospholipid/cholesterol/gamma-HCH transport system substrate-binding protein
MARRNVAEVLTGGVVLLATAGFLAYAVAHSGRSVSSGYTLVAKFDHIDGLPAGSDVRMAGVKVGSVLTEEVDPKTYLAVVTLSVQNGLELPKDTSVAVTSDGLLGGKFLSLSPGGDTAMLQPGQTITITQSSISLEDLLGKFIFSVTDLVGAMKPTQDQDKPPAPGAALPAGSPSNAVPAPPPAAAQPPAPGKS